MNYFAFEAARTNRRLGLLSCSAVVALCLLPAVAGADEVPPSPTVSFTDAPTCVSYTSMPYASVTFTNDCAAAITVTNVHSVYAEDRWDYPEDGRFVLLPGESAIIEAAFGEDLGWEMEDGTEGTIEFEYVNPQADSGCNAAGGPEDLPIGWAILLGLGLVVRRRVQVQPS